MHTPQRARLVVAILGATIWSACAIKSHPLTRESRRTPHLPKRRSATVNPDCAPFPNKRVVLVTPNAEYWDMFQNWYSHAQKYLDGSSQLVVMAQDEEIVTKHLRNSKFTYVDMQGKMHEPLREFVRRLARQVVRRLRLRSASSQSVGDFGSLEFNRLTGRRPEHILQFLNVGCTVLYSDIDNVWLGDVFQGIGQVGKHDVYIAPDSPDPSDLQKNLCSCFLYLQPTERVKGLVQKWAAKVSDDNNDQPFWQQAVAEMGHTVDYTILPYDRFPPGRNADDYYPGKNVLVLHANWRVGLPNKQGFLRDHGKWIHG